MSRRKKVFLINLFVRLNSAFQAQVVMRIVDPQVAIAMLHRDAPSTNQPFHQQVAAQFPSGLSLFQRYYV